MKKTWLLAFLVLLAWGCSWPTMKLVLPDIPPLWLASARLGIGTIVLFILLAFSKQRFWPTRKDLPFLLSVGLVQMGIFTLLIVSGVTQVAAGRSAILVYTTPLWVTPIAVLLFKEPLSRLTLAGLSLGLVGILTLFNPVAFDWHNHKIIFGNGLLLIAAWIWSAVILHIRYGKHYSKPLELAPWQMLLATALALIIAIIFEPKPEIHPSSTLILGLLYLGPFATAFAYWGIIELNRQFQAISLSLLLLVVPIIGLLSSFILVKEPISLNILLAMALITMGLMLIIYGNKPARIKKDILESEKKC
ncbi:MAG: DMT family transporter [Proteobacteria bacterium]|nr:DMT family transporter [Pseudomonadota bacterium]